MIVNIPPIGETGGGADRSINTNTPNAHQRDAKINEANRSGAGGGGVCSGAVTGTLAAVLCVILLNAPSARIRDSITHNHTHTKSRNSNVPSVKRARSHAWRPICAAHADTVLTHMLWVWVCWGAITCTYNFCARARKLRCVTEIKTKTSSTPPPPSNTTRVFMRRYHNTHVQRHTYHDALAVCVCWHNHLSPQHWVISASIGARPADIDARMLVVQAATPSHATRPV